MTFRKKDIFKITTQRSHVSADTSFFWREAARWAGMDYDVFQSKPGLEQSTIVAHFRTSRQLEAVIAADQAKQAARNAKRKP